MNTYFRSRAFVNSTKVVDFFDNREDFIKRGKGPKFMDAINDIDAFINDPTVIF